MGAIWLYGAINHRNMAGLSVLYKQEKKSGCGPHKLRICPVLLRCFPESASFPRFTEYEQRRAKERRSPEALVQRCRRSGAERWPGYIQQPSVNHGLTGGFRHVWEKKGGVLYYRGMATCKSYPSSNDHAGFSSCVSSWLVKMLTWSRKRSNDDLFKLMISIIHCCYTLILCGLHKTFLYSLV